VDNFVHKMQKKGQTLKTAVVDSTAQAT
jgi:hypothetical protein